MPVNDCVKDAVAGPPVAVFAAVASLIRPWVVLPIAGADGLNGDSAAAKLGRANGAQISSDAKRVEGLGMNV